MSLLKPVVASLIESVRTSITDRFRAVGRLRFSLRVHRLERSPRTPWRPRQIQTRILLVALGVIAVGGWLYYRVQIGEIEAVRIPGDAPVELEIAKMRLDAIRNTLTVAAGLGGAAALVLGFRRQQHEEFHSTQQRIMDLRAQAVEQLTSDNATVRKNGLLTLERLGEQHEELRKTVLDEICNYLRRPHETDDREARRCAQEILQRRLDRSLGIREYWSHERIDLTRARLDGADFRGCHLRNADFTGAVFTGYTCFERSSFTGATMFTRAEFEAGADFMNVTFRGGALFEAAVFKGAVNFSWAGFESHAYFASASFHDGTDFRWAVFEREALLDRAVFYNEARFKYADFRGWVNARSVGFRDTATFDHAKFRDDAAFEGTEFAGVTTFEFATFRGDARFDAASFHGRATFLAVAFEHDARFREADFQGSVTFWGSTFNGDATFQDTSLSEDIVFDLVSFWRPLNRSQLPAGWELRELPRPSRYLHMVRDNSTESSTLSVRSGVGV